jgi:hypothetical protein
VVTDSIGGYDRVFKMENGTEYTTIASTRACNCMLGTRVTITLEEPELPKERIVLPEGMKWIDHYDKQSGILDYSTLFTIDGFKIAKILHMVTYEYFCTCFAPWEREVIKFYKKTLKEGKEEVLEECARNNWYGITKTHT